MVSGDLKVRLPWTVKTLVQQGGGAATMIEMLVPDAAILRARNQKPDSNYRLSNPLREWAIILLYARIFDTLGLKRRR